MMDQTTSHHTISGRWLPGNILPSSGPEDIRTLLNNVLRPVVIIRQGGQLTFGNGGSVILGDDAPFADEGYPLYAYSPSLHPENLGDPIFKKKYDLQYGYVVGAMANGITSVEMVEAAARAGLIGFFGAAGLSPSQIDNAIYRLQQRLNELPFGFNLIHSPNAPELEAKIVELYLERGIRRISASAYMEMTLPLVYYRVKGIREDGRGKIICPNKIIAKVSRVEVARKFLSPPPPRLLHQLLQKNMITQKEAELAGQVALAQDMTAEADSGGHTDNRPALSLLPTMLALRDEMAAKYNYQEPLCVGLGGGIATPEATAAAFAMGAAFVLTGSINQACMEAGTSETVRQMLAEAGQADVTMAPAADMFEIGVKVQVLKRGTMFPFRAAKLYDIYDKNDSLETIPTKEQAMLERDFFRCTFDEEWEKTKNFFCQRDPDQIERAHADPKHKMALVFRSYLGCSSDWANSGDPSRKLDYQIWCGPSMGAFNEWVRGSFLEKPQHRNTVTVAMNLLYGAAVKIRAGWLRCQGMVLPASAEKFTPLKLSEIRSMLRKNPIY